MRSVTIEATPAENKTSEAKCAPTTILDRPTNIAHPVISTVSAIFFGFLH